MYVCEPVLPMIEPVQCLWTRVMYMSHCYDYEPLLCLWTSVMDVKECYLCEKLLCIWTIAIFVNQCNVYESLLCLWASAMFVNQCNVYELMLCLWTSVMYMSHCYVYEPVLCLWASAMFVNQCYIYEPVLCLRTPVFLVNQGYTYLWWWQCGFLSVWRHHRPSSGTEKHNSTTWCPPKRRTKKYPVLRSPSQNLVGKKQDVKVLWKKVTFSGGYWDWSHLGRHTGYISTFDILE